VIAAIFFGIAGALAASTLFELARQFHGWQRTGDQSAHRSTPPEPKLDILSQRAQKRWRFVALVALLLLLLRTLGKRHNKQEN
jgi:hypothetical protein